MSHSIPHIAPDTGACICGCDKCRGKTTSIGKRFGTNCICPDCTLHIRPTYTGPQCTECDTLLVLRQRALNMMTDMAQYNYSNLFITARQFRMETSRALAWHEVKCEIAKINGRIIPLDIAAMLLDDKGPI